MLAGHGGRGHRYLARLLANNPFTSACRGTAPAAAAQQQAVDSKQFSACTGAESSPCTHSTAHSRGGMPPAAARPQPWQQQCSRGFASGDVTSDGPPADGLPPHSDPLQPLHQAGGAAAAGGEPDWTQPDGAPLTPRSQPSLQESSMDELMARWEAMMDADADPLEILDTVWSSIEGEPGLPDWQEILERGDEEEALERAARRSRERQIQEEFAEKRVRVVDELGRSYATGKRKTSIARAWLKAGSGVITVNGRPMTSYFSPLPRRADVLAPFITTGTLGMFDVYATVRGGGQTGQAQALRHGIARALQLFDPGHRPALKVAGLLTRDSRIVERKKPGLAKARKAFQWVKR